MHHFLISLILLLGPVSSFAHSNHHHGKKIKKDQVIVRAKFELGKLVKNEKLEKSWLEATIVSFEIKTFEKKNKSGKVLKTIKEWVVSFNNAKIKDEKKKILFIFLNLKGKFVAANFSGR
ncbi:MAG: hypothetical protein HOE90_17870 [Bacteriovoracaceae bacterium]|jgi:hypothetical protein|nr:hypothetical protein [Bacteriovoracaceae bacterium]